MHAELPVATTINDKLLYSGVGSKLKVVGGGARLKNLDKQNKGLWYVKICKKKGGKEGGQAPMAPTPDSNAYVV